MTREASEEEDEAIVHMKNRILQSMRLHQNRDVGVDSLIALLIKEYQDASHDKQAFMRHMEKCWDYYEDRKEISPKQRAVQKLFRVFYKES
jgi:hypothetical protein